MHTSHRCFHAFLTCNRDSRLTMKSRAITIGTCPVESCDYCCDRQARAASAQRFTMWQEATIEITRRDHSIIACSRHIYGPCFSCTFRSWWIAHSIASLAEWLQQYVCLAPLRHYRNSPSRFSYFTALFSWLTIGTCSMITAVEFAMHWWRYRRYWNVCNMSLISFSLAVIFIIIWHFLESSVSCVFHFQIRRGCF